MRTLFYLIYKDILVLIRDRGGLAMLFIMPAALVLIMTNLQDTTFRSINESGIQLILLNHDNDSLGQALENEIIQSRLFKVHKLIDQKIPDDSQVKEAVASGKFQIGFIIPEGATQYIRNQIRNNIAMLFSPTPSSISSSDSLYFMVYLDPTTKISFRETLQGHVREMTTRIENQIIFGELARELNMRFRLTASNTLLKNETIFYKEEYAARKEKKVLPNSVQHNVPAWTLFAIFFIVIPFAGAMIREREDGSLARLLTMPCSYFTIVLSKIIVYLIVCYLQFATILAMGVYLLPLFNLPPLNIEGQLEILSLLALAVALAAIGYGLAIGTIANTHQQAAIFASISVVILAAIGGIWVPVFIMPPLMRQLSVISPLNWGLNSFYDILIRGASFRDIMPNCIFLLCFATGCLLLALYFHKIRKEFI
jgi:ABC-2 type transport system permease protein